MKTQVEIEYNGDAELDIESITLALQHSFEGEIFTVRELPPQPGQGQVMENKCKTCGLDQCKQYRIREKVYKEDDTCSDWEPVLPEEIIKENSCKTCRDLLHNLLRECHPPEGQEGCERWLPIPIKPEQGEG